jgi:hypothetical protein
MRQEHFLTNMGAMRSTAKVCAAVKEGDFSGERRSDDALGVPLSCSRRIGGALVRKMFTSHNLQRPAQNRYDQGDCPDNTPRAGFVTRENQPENRNDTQHSKEWQICRWHA